MPSDQPSNDVFINYRRSVSGYISLAVYQNLKEFGIDAFYDIENIDAGNFEMAILNQIAARPYFMPILTPGSLERCREPNDWVLRELQEALRLNRIIIPLHTPEFNMADLDMHLPPNVAAIIKRYQMVEIPQKWFRYAMQDLRDRYLKPILLPVTPPPASDQPIVAEKEIKAAAAPRVDEQHLTAETYFTIGKASYYRNDLTKALATFSEAIRLNPSFAEAYNNRGNVHSEQGDLNAAIADYNEAIRLKPDLVEAYAGRGIAHGMIGALNSAIADFDQAISLRPTYAEAYCNRGIVYADQRDLNAALDDFNHAIQLNPNDALAHANRGTVLADQDDLAGALADYDEAIRLDPKQAAAYYNRGTAYAEHKDYASAIADKLKFLELEPTSALAPLAKADIETWSKLKAD